MSRRDADGVAAAAPAADRDALVPAAAGQPERLDACEVCGLVRPWPAPRACPACGSGFG